MNAFEAACELPLGPGRRVAFDVAEGTWMSLDVAPDGASIVFDLLGDLYRLEIGGGAAEPLGRSMAFNAQPAFSPDGRLIAFVSDLSGAENVWVATPDGAELRRVTANESAHSFVSPAWAPDGRSLCVCVYRSDRNAVELWRYAIDARPPQRLCDDLASALGPVFAPTGAHLYLAAHDGPVFQDDVALPRWRIDRLDLETGLRETVVANPGGAMRPRLSPDGRRLAYAARYEGRTGLRLRELESGADRWLVWPVDQDAQEALPTRDLLPGYAFTPDGASLVAAYGGRINRIDLATGEARRIEFRARVERGVGPSLRRDFADEAGPVRARIVSDPALSSDGKRLAFSALGELRVQDVAGGDARLVAGGPAGGYMPAWAPDDASLAYVGWTAREAGHVWIAAADGSGEPRRLTDIAAFYTHPAFSPDGRQVLALRSSNYDRMHTYMEPVFTGRAFGALRQAELVELPLDGGPPRILASGMMSGPPQVTDAPDVVHLLFDDGLNEVRLDGAGRRPVLQVVGPGYYFLEAPQPADDIRISPDRAWALVQHVQQLHLLDLSLVGEPAQPLDLSTPGPAHRRLTRDGADFLGWADQGRTIVWALGARVCRLPLDEARAGARGPAGAIEVRVEAPRDRPAGRLVLRGATAVTMRGDEVIEDAEIVIEGSRIVAVQRRGTATIPDGAEVRDLGGAFVTPGLIDTHAHWACVRRGVLDLHNWDLEASLAYGVTAGLDPSTLTIDLIAYQDLQEAGRILGPRIYSTGVAVFSFNRFASLEETRDGLSRYARDYRTHNLKQYRTGNRRVRQWVAAAAHELALMPTTEGALDMKLDLTQVIDGFAGNEHALSPTPLYDDVARLMAATRTSYTPTLQCSHGGPQGLHAFVQQGDWLHDAKVARFFPPFMRDRLFARGPWAAEREYLYAQVASGAAAVMRAGGLVGVGSHGNVSGLGMHWEMQAYVAGGFTPHEALRAATLGSAETIGRKGQLGSLEPGKLADLLVLDRDPLADIRNSTALRMVMQNGRLYDAETLDEAWPRRRARPRPWFADDTPAGDAALSRRAAARP